MANKIESIITCFKWCLVSPYTAPFTAMDSEILIAVFFLSLSGLALISSACIGYHVMLSLNIEPANFFSMKEHSNVAIQSSVLANPIRIAYMRCIITDFECVPENMAVIPCCYLAEGFWRH